MLGGAKVSLAEEEGRTTVPGGAKASLAEEEGRTTVLGGAKTASLAEEEGRTTVPGRGKGVTRRRRGADYRAWFGCGSVGYSLRGGRLTRGRGERLALRGGPWEHDDPEGVPSRGTPLAIERKGKSHGTPVELSGYVSGTGKDLTRKGDRFY